VLSCRSPSRLASLSCLALVTLTLIPNL
jgi:hypothetical protein